MDDFFKSVKRFFKRLLIGAALAGTMVMGVTAAVGYYAFERGKQAMNALEEAKVMRSLQDHDATLGNLRRQDAAPAPVSAPSATGVPAAQDAYSRSMQEAWQNHDLEVQALRRDYATNRQACDKSPFLSNAFLWALGNPYHMATISTADDYVDQKKCLVQASQDFNAALKRADQSLMERRHEIGVQYAAPGVGR